MKLIDKPITKKDLLEIAKRLFGNFVKGVVDIEKKVMVIDGELHADEEKYLLESGSKQDNLWGINLYPELTGEEFIEFDSMINVRPRCNNFSREVEDVTIRQRITVIVTRLVKE